MLLLSSCHERNPFRIDQDLKHTVHSTQTFVALIRTGHYNLVIIDKRTRYPVVERVSLTSLQINKERLKHVFACCETPRCLESDNGAPFNSNDIKRLATPLHNRANGETEQ